MVRRLLDQRRELLAGVAGGEPVRDVAALRNIRPMLREIQAPHALGDAEREPARSIGMLIASRIVVVENDDMCAGELLAVGLHPLRPLARLTRAVGVTRRRNADAPKVVDVLLSFHDRNHAAVGDRLRYLAGAIDNLRVDVLGARFPSAVSVRLFEPKARLASRQVAHLAKMRRTAGVAVHVASQRPPLPIAPRPLLRAPPSAVIAAPMHGVVAFDGDAEDLVFLVRLAALA